MPNPRDLAHLAAVVDLLDEGVIPNLPNVAGKLGVTKQAVWNRLHDREGLADWLGTSLQAVNRELVGAVQRKMALIALKGSEPHARLFLQSMGLLKPDQPAGPGGAASVVLQIVNIPGRASVTEWPGGTLEAKR